MQIGTSTATEMQLAAQVRKSGRLRRPSMLLILDHPHGPQASKSFWWCWNPQAGAHNDRHEMEYKAFMAL